MTGRTEILNVRFDYCVDTDQLKGSISILAVSYSTFDSAIFLTLYSIMTPLDAFEISCI